MQKWLCPALDAGFFIFRTLFSFLKITLEGRAALCGSLSPARQVPETLGHSDGLGTKRSLTTERLASSRR